MPKASYGDRYTVTAICGEKEVVFDFSSEVLDFAVSHNGERGYASALFVLCEEELVTIDLEHPLWRCIPLQYFYPLHSSPVTSVTVYSNVAEKIWAKLYEAKERLRTTSREYSTRGWPLSRNCNETTAAKEAASDPLVERSILVTGHENGVFKVWDTSSGGFNLLISHETAREFEGYKEETPKPDMLRRQYSSVSSGGTITSDEDDNDPNWPPFRKVGLYDPFADDTRLAVSKLSFDPDTGEIVVGGRSGHTIAYELQTASKFLPVTAVTAVAWHPSSHLVAVGNEFGYAIYSLSAKQALVLKSLISTNEILEISNLDGALSRFKSMKKSIRQSFRRKKRAMERHLENPSECDAASSIIDDFRSGERQIACRSANPNVLGGEPPHSLVRVLQFARCSLLEGEPVDYYLFVGTSGSSILIHSLTSTSGEQCPLVREIRLQHRAPIVHLDIIPSWNGASRLLVMSEEQIRTFNLPGLKSGRFKCKFTATEGLRIRKAQVLAKTNARKHKHPEPFVGFVTNQGTLYVMSLLHPRRQYNARFTRHTDASGIAMSSLSAEGELFFLRPGGTEFQRSRI
ncbi:lethal giant larvae [Aphelenchoides avenae]|nr:lethal giant larvae [Aphelenchus avenae]